MAILEVTEAAQGLSFNADNCLAQGTARAAEYQGASPFPHIVMDDFLSPDLLRGLLADFPSSEGKDFFDREQEQLKFQYAPDEVRIGQLRNLLHELNSKAFVSFLESMTGITGLIPDPHFLGGGLHEIKQGGHLGIHADFNVHNRLKLQRRLNLLIYLNDDWSPEYGGNLELWDVEMKACCVKVLPVLGRAVVFNTDLDSFHGHPDALTCPENRTRRSIATYYYTAPEEGIASLPKRTTVFKQRPDSADSFDYKVAIKHFVDDWTPPKIRQWLRR